MVIGMGLFCRGFLSMVLVVRQGQNKDRMEVLCMNNTYCSYLKIKKGTRVILTVFLCREGIV